MIKDEGRKIMQRRGKSELQPNTKVQKENENKKAPLVIMILALWAYLERTLWRVCRKTKMLSKFFGF